MVEKAKTHHARPGARSRRRRWARSSAASSSIASGSYQEIGKTEAKLAVGGGRADRRRARPRLLRRADDLLRRRQLRAHRARGDLRSGGLRHPVRRRGRGGAHRQRHLLRPRRRGLDARHLPRDARRQEAPRRHRLGQPHAADRTSRRRGAATSRAASAASSGRWGVEEYLQRQAGLSSTCRKQPDRLVLLFARRPARSTMTLLRRQGTGGGVSHGPQEHDQDRRRYSRRASTTSSASPELAIDRRRRSCTSRSLHDVSDAAPRRTDSESRTINFQEFMKTVDGRRGHAATKAEIVALLKTEGEKFASYARRPDRRDVPRGSGHDASRARRRRRKRGSRCCSRRRSTKCTIAAS